LSPRAQTSGHSRQRLRSSHQTLSALARLAEIRLRESIGPSRAGFAAMKFNQLVNFSRIG
jgi:hypothetical protein